jgi:hypothetical protein
MLLADIVDLLRTAGFGDPPVEHHTAAASIPHLEAQPTVQEELC